MKIKLEAMLFLLIGMVAGLLLAGLLYILIPQQPFQGLPSGCPVPDFSCETGELPSEARKDFYWGLISIDKVEPVCLDQARKYAGEKALAVLGCSCTESIGESEKIYDCTVSAIDGQHPLKISCIREHEKCSIESEAGTFELSFEQLYTTIYS